VSKIRSTALACKFIDKKCQWAVSKVPLQPVRQMSSVQGGKMLAQLACVWFLAVPTPLGLIRVEELSARPTSMLCPRQV